MPNFQPMELLIILAVILLLFGAKKLPDLARSLGKAKTEFHKGVDEATSESSPKNADEGDSEPATQPASEKTEP